MKKSILFKTLVDIVYFLHFIGLIGILFIIPFETIHINQASTNVENWNLPYWSVYIVSLAAYILFLRGLYYLRKMARHLLSNKHFSGSIIQNLKKSGNHFLYTGIISFILFATLRISKLGEGECELIYDNNLLIPLFLTIIGMFFIIQSNALHLAKGIKEENELTV
ncbi:DUF2975 domain-containing protein [Zobellia galactanivorans]|uniref:DUF2975 domain-containing protein n=1 Tax=Zobellia galactanivorans (strain DSM 12802 / CCUG 47099 / CIP 106680 / NCIMB 13871 / Dsij) TaxID=63186 RepID=UPI001C06850C|nr:DUF2975 domain-containing protein [Zobellia galactanivorans]MBU3026047.1 DUF2975 domain-containing protein [Zobellia galactanivorans]